MPADGGEAGERPLRRRRLHRPRSITTGGRRTSSGSSRSRGNVYALYGRGGNIGFFVGPDAVLVVDSQFKDIAPGIVAEIRKVSDKPIKFLLNTHHHGDHVGGNEVFKQFAMIVAHDNVRKRMLSSPADIQRDYPAMLENAKKAGNEQAVKCCPSRSSGRRR